MTNSIEEINEASATLYKRYKEVQILLFKNENDIFNEFVDGYIDIALETAISVMKSGEAISLSASYDGLQESLKHFEKFQKQNPDSNSEFKKNIGRFSRAIQSSELISQDIYSDPKERIEHIKNIRDLMLATAYIETGADGIEFMNDTLTLWNQKIAESDSNKNLTQRNITAEWKRTPSELQRLIKAIKGMGLTSRTSDIEAIFLGKNTSFRLKEGKLLVFIGLIAELKRRECFVTYPANKHFALFEMLYVPDGPKRPKASYFRKRAYDIYNENAKYSEIRNEISRILINASLISL